MQTPKYAIVLKASTPENSLIYTFSDEALWNWLNREEAFDTGQASKGTSVPSLPIEAATKISIGPRGYRLAKAQCITDYAVASKSDKGVSQAHPELKCVDFTDFPSTVLELTQRLGKHNVFRSSI